MSEWLSYGYDETTFWTITPKTYQVYIDAAAVRLTREYNANIDLAYAIARFNNSDLKKLKPEKHYAKDPIKERKKTFKDRNQQLLFDAMALSSHLPAISWEETKAKWLEDNPDQIQ